ncbi:MAG: hypothetical protein CBC48_08100 [bacterium TMED88]|nr:chromosome partitioning protein ParB [Deltaproteobacteria bacterium]OUV32636.1 MAG: hypothetical protein CBC48_08100 [bacterium TMED88]
MAEKKISSKKSQSQPGKKKAARKKSVRKKTARQKAGARKRLRISDQQRGLSADQIALSLDTPELSALRQAVQDAGGAPIGAYREPLSGRPILVASLPIKAVEPTPFQRDLSPTHTKRLSQKIEESGLFLDPIIVVQGEKGRFWTPNGRHRLASAKVLGLQQITALISPEEDLAFRILALNTEKAHNLKDRSLEVIRMAQTLAVRSKRAKESDFSSEFEAPELLTLGLVYLESGRFAGGAYSPLLKKVDRFSEKTLGASLKERANWAKRFLSIDAEVKRIIEELQQRGFRSPYLRNYVVARINPVRFHRAKKGETEPPMTVPAALMRMKSAARRFDTQSVRDSDVALVASVSSGSD